MTSGWNAARALGAMGVALLSFAALAGESGAYHAVRTFLPPGTWVCPSSGWFNGSSASEKAGRGHCYQVVLKPDEVVVMDYDAPYVYVCEPIRGADRTQLLCGYATEDNVAGANGVAVPGAILAKIARTKTMADVHRIR